MRKLIGTLVILTGVFYAGKFHATYQVLEKFSDEDVDTDEMLTRYVESRDNMREATNTMIDNIKKNVENAKTRSKFEKIIDEGGLG